MAFLLRLATSSLDDQEILQRSGLTYTWGGLFTKSSVTSVCAASGTWKFNCVNEAYNQCCTIRDDEHDRRAMRE